MTKATPAQVSATKKTARRQGTAGFLRVAVFLLVVAGIILGIAALVGLGVYFFRKR